jgi:archaellum component FlaC
MNTHDINQTLTDIENDLSFVFVSDKKYHNSFESVDDIATALEKVFRYIKLLREDVKLLRKDVNRNHESSISWRPSE